MQIQISNADVPGILEALEAKASGLDADLKRLRKTIDDIRSQANGSTIVAKTSSHDSDDNKPTKQAKAPRGENKRRITEAIQRTGPSTTVELKTALGISMSSIQAVLKSANGGFVYDTKTGRWSLGKV